MNINNSFINVIRDKRIKDIYGNDLILFILFFHNFFFEFNFYFIFKHIHFT